MSQIGTPNEFAAIHISAEDTAYFNIQNIEPNQRGLEPLSIYRVVDSERTQGIDQEHIAITFSDKVIEIVGCQLHFSYPRKATSALQALILYAQESGVGS